MKKRVCIVGSGNWGSAISRVIGQNCQENALGLEREVRMWVFEETINGRKLTDIINNDHENVKYLPGVTLPDNVRAIPDLPEAVQGADVIVFVLPHQFIQRTCESIKGMVNPNALGVTLIKGFEVKPDQDIVLISQLINKILGIKVGVLMGANLAPEVASENFAEATIAFEDLDDAKIIRKVFERPYFRMSCVTEVVSVELCGALKNIVAVGAGFVDGLGFGDNTKAAIIRLGLLEIVNFCSSFYVCNDKTIFLESCGVADLVTTCYGGRHRRVAEAFVRTGKTMDELQQEMLNGQILQGPVTAKKVYEMLRKRNVDKDYPIFVGVYKVCYEGMPADDLFKLIQSHPQP